MRDSADPLPEVQLVRGLVDQDATTLAAPGGPPIGLVVVALWTPPGRDDPAGPPDRPDLAGVDDLLDPLVERVVALIEHDPEGELGMGGRAVVELLDLTGVDAGRFLHQGMDSRLQGRDAHLR